MWLGGQRRGGKRERSRARSKNRPSPHGSQISYGVPSVEELEDVVALALHELLRERLEVQPEQRLGVRRAHVQVPVLGLDRDPVQVRNLALGAEPFLDLLQLRRHPRPGR